MEKTYLLTEEAIGSAGRLLDEHDEDIQISEKVFNVIQKIYNQLIASNEVEAYVLGTNENVKLLTDCCEEFMSKTAKEEFDILYETACAINNNW